MKKFDPIKETEAYKAIIEERGYDAFSRQAVDEWNSKYGHMNHTAITDLVNGLTENFMKSLADPAHPNHMQNRQDFKDKFGGSEETLKAHNRKFVNEQYGRSFRNNAPHHKDTSYENRMVTPKRNALSMVALSERNVLKNLMQARWGAQGYNDNDSAYVNRFYDEYAMDLEKPDHLCNAEGNAGGDAGGHESSVSRETTPMAKYMARQRNEAKSQL